MYLTVHVSSSGNSEYASLEKTFLKWSAHEPSGKAATTEIVEVFN